MDAFMFVLLGKPGKDSSEYGKVKYAHIHIWVMSSDSDSALNKAMDYVTQYHWILESVEHEFHFLPEQLPQLDANEFLLYQKARTLGIAADFVAVSVEPLDAPAVRRMNP